MGAKKVPVVKGVRLRRKEHVNKSEDVHSINTKSDKIVGESQISPKISPLLWEVLMKSATKTDIRLYACLLVFRIINAWMIQTSFVPDEYWQSLEVAHKAIFGYGYLTWEWRKGLRSYLYPFFFSCYYFLLKLLNLDSRCLIAKGPMFIQSTLSALGDLYMYKTAYKISSNHRVARWTLLCQLTSWYLFYSSTRTLSNSTEGSLVAIALFFYPWSKKEASGCPAFITLVCLSIILRPTALIVWTPMILQQLKSSLGSRNFCSLIFSWVAIGSVTMVLSAAMDYLFYGDFINVYYNFFKFNVMSGLSSIYGIHQWHWYFTQGFITILFTHVVMFAMAILRWQHTLFIITIMWTITIYSFLPHKEFRFLSGVLPFTFHLCGMALHHYIDGPHVSMVQNHVKIRADQNQDKDKKFKQPNSDNKPIKNENHTSKFLVAMLLISLNAAPAIYTCMFHQRGALDVMEYLSEQASQNPKTNILFLLPCHSTPYYSHIHKNITMNFLTCEPNLDHKDSYIDEADTFFSEPSAWISKQKWPTTQHFKEVTESVAIPTHIIMFESLFVQLSPHLTVFGFTKCANFFHTHFPAGRIAEYLIVVCK